MEALTLKDRIQELKDRWFLTEPAYFMVLCTHVVEINPGIKCGIACGGGYIYLNEEYFADKTDKFLDECMKMEIMRILLKHPYQRQLSNRVKMYLASNFVLANNMKLQEMHLKTTREAMGTWEYDRECLEAIYDAINLPEMGGEGKSGGKSLTGKSGSGSGKGNQQKQNQHGNGSGNGQGQSQSGDGDGDPSGQKNDPLKDFDDACSSSEDAFDRTQFWKEDDYRVVEVNGIIDKIDSTNSWGTIPGNVVDVIKKSLEPKFNYKAMFQQFRSTIYSSNYDKTRMKPSRRFGYAAMGTKRKNTTSLLVAVDTSGSISDEDLQLCFGFFSKFFNYAVETFDVIQFDTQIYEDSLCTFAKRPKSWKIKGRGGTDFNDVFKYVQKDSKKHYDGVLIVTDGYACRPDTKYLNSNYGHTKYLWVLNSEENWKRFKENKDFAKFGKCTYVAKR